MRDPYVLMLGSATCKNTLIEKKSKPSRTSQLQTQGNEDMPNKPQAVTESSIIS